MQKLPSIQPKVLMQDLQNKYGHKQMIKLNSNENPYGYSLNVIESIKNIDHLHFYPEVNDPLLFQKLANLLGVQVQQIIFGNGSDELIQMVCRAFLQPGDESILAKETFPGFLTEIQIEGALPIQVPLKNGVHDLNQMKQMISHKTKIIWLCNPNNPTGTIFTHQSLVDFLNQLPKNILVVIDEAYAEYVLDTNYPKSLALLSNYPQLIVIRTFSKIYGLAGIRLGYGIAHPKLIHELHKVRPPCNINRIAQQAAIAALADQKFVDYCRNTNEQQRRRLYDHLNKWNLPYYVSHGNFIMFDMKYPSKKVYQFLLEHGIIVRYFPNYPTHIRMTIGTPKQNQVFINIFSRFLESH